MTANIGLLLVVVNYLLCKLACLIAILAQTKYLVIIFPFLKEYTIVKRKSHLLMVTAFINLEILAISKLAMI